MELGELTALLLFGVWRPAQPDLKITPEEVSEIAPLLVNSGSGALGWWRVRHSELRDCAGGIQLRHCYRQYALEAKVGEAEIKRVFSFFRSLGLKPLLGKGWAVARLYPQEGLRPFGDIDLYLAPDDYPAAAVALEGPEAPKCQIDLHAGSAELDDRSFDALYEHSQSLRLDEVDVQILGPEDHLRLLCLHTLRHGAWRPLWLCDIAVALESRPSHFDWDYFMSGDKRRSDWVTCALGLAHQLLGANIDDTPAGNRARRLPSWLVPTVLRQWSVGQKPHGQRIPMKDHLRHPSGVLQALRVRWPNAIEATVGVRGPFNELPRLPFQLSDGVFRAVRFLKHVNRGQLLCI
jgi:hypothetical protein